MLELALVIMLHSDVREVREVASIFALLAVLLEEVLYLFCKFARRFRPISVTVSGFVKTLMSGQCGPGA